MFPGTSQQTMREPDLGNPYRVDLGTAGKKDVKTGARKEQVRTDDKAQIDKMTKNYENAVEKHEIAMKSVQETQVELEQYAEQLQYQ